MPLRLTASLAPAFRPSRPSHPPRDRRPHLRLDRRHLSPRSLTRLSRPVLRERQPLLVRDPRDPRATSFWLVALDPRGPLASAASPCVSGVLSALPSVIASATTAFLPMSPIFATRPPKKSHTRPLPCGRCSGPEMWSIRDISGHFLKQRSRWTGGASCLAFGRSGDRKCHARRPCRSCPLPLPSPREAVSRPGTSRGGSCRPTGGLGNQKQGHGPGRAGKPSRTRCPVCPCPRPLPPSPPSPL